jgi:hypothetical protein
MPRCVAARQAEQKMGKCGYISIRFLSRDSFMETPVPVEKLIRRVSVEKTSLQDDL